MKYRMSKKIYKMSNMWNSAFKALEVAFDGEDINSNLENVMKIVTEFTEAYDLQIYRLNKLTGKITDYAVLDPAKPSLLLECFDFFRKEKENEKIDTNDKRISIVSVETKYNKYAIAIKNNISVDEVINHKYIDIIKRIFKVIFENHEMYTTDSLTQISNRAHYTEVTDKMFKDGPKEITYSLIDLFRLKFINDNYGHLYGDKYIKKAATLLSEILDEDDMIFRIGGDEFVVLSRRMTKERLQEKFKGVNLKLSTENFGKKLSFPLMINYGVVEMEDQLDGLYQKADKELSKNKSETYKRLHLDRRK